MSDAFTLRHLMCQAPRLALYGLCVVLSVVCTMATALSVSDFLNILFAPANGDAAPLPTGGNLLQQALGGLYAWLISFGQQRALLYFALLLVALYSLKNLFGYLAAAEMAVVRCRVVRNIRDELFAKAMRLPLSYFGTARKGDILTRFGGDLVEYDEGTLASVQQLVTAIVSMVLYVAMLFYISTRLTLFVLCMLPVIAFVISGITHRLRRNSLELQQRYAFLTSLMEETIMGLKVIKAYTAIGFSNSRFRESDAAYSRLRTRVYRRIDLSSPVSDFLGNSVVIAILLFGSSIVLAGGGGLTSELFVSYIMLFVLMIPPAKDLTTAISQMKKGRGGVDRIVQFLSAEERAGDNPEAAPFDGLEHEIAFRHVGFGYRPGIPVLQDVSLTVPKGSTIAIVGSSGSGKSTLCDLLLRFIDPEEGDIVVDGRPLDTLRLADLRRHIGVVAQDTVLFNDTIRANIAFGRPASDEAVVRAAKAANAHDFILRCPEGYNTSVGDGGSLLSGGQRQRLSIARALLQDPDLLILDEATSALDTESERLVQQALDTLLAGRTAIVIAHRLSTIRHAHSIVVLEQGRIVEQGTHDQLMSLNGRYRQLVEMQSFR